MMFVQRPHFARAGNSVSWHRNTIRPLAEGAR